MPLIELTTVIDAPIDRCFDLDRSIDLHKLSTEGTEEEAIAGVTSGLIGEGQEVTWRAKHFSIIQTLSSRITAYKRPYYFRDEMIKGIFKCLEHDHLFSTVDGKTIMKDKFCFESPCGATGVLVNHLLLNNYLRSLLAKRNKVIKRFAESEEWKTILTLK